VRAYYKGDAAALDAIPRSQDGSDFQKRVWQAIGAIPYGSTLSYKQLAASSGNPAAIRAAGTICGLNRLILLVPCHRILKSDGSIGSYLYGPAIKTSLLRHEKAI
jgi:methylated-DNA-[protein]-cysteine S-methyltransferase